MAVFYKFKNTCCVNTRRLAGVLNKVHARIIADRLSLLLSATVGAFTLAAWAAGRPVYEEESRHDWDALLYRFYVGTDEIISPNVLLERSLRFSRNGAVDIDDLDTLVSSQKKLAEEYFDHCTDALTAVHTIDRNIQPQALAALTRAGAFQSQINSSEDPTKMAEIVKNRASSEPATGNCDAILVTPISDSLTEGNRFGNVGAMKFPVTFSLVQSPQSADQKTPSDSKNKQREDNLGSITIHRQENLH
ncbi:hypothetical protein PILCRDRAFT_376392 [Piloderma croceum F 1598]|uniref:Uncharacterized protein n=1 Tax=Piloderma croceum (strain F 1598) TaxID=765440 RepID=A0A0C3G2Q7_PILCF|nr:hypothetical protein PILCRDRAFT_376392 [Piloderma croceum F 1598]